MQVMQGQWIRILSLEDPVQDYALQMTEIEVIGRVQERPRLVLSRVGTAVTLTWSTGALEQADAVAGPWSSVAGASSPYTVPPAPGQRFYRLRGE